MNRDTAAAKDSLLISMRGRPAVTDERYFTRPGVPDGPPIRVSLSIARELIRMNMANPADEEAVDEMKSRGFNFPLGNDLP